MSLDSVRTDIETEIVTNGIQAITALVLNPILTGLIDAIEAEIGDLADLPTSDQSNLVAAIQELWNLYQSISTTESEDFLGVYGTFEELVAAYPTATAGQFAIVLEDGSDNTGIFEYVWNAVTEQFELQTGVQGGDITMLVTSADFDGVASLKFDWDVDDFTITQTDNGGISIELKNKPAQKTLATTIDLSKTNGTFYNMTDADPAALFFYDNEILGGRAQVLIRTGSSATRMPAVSKANDIKGKGDQLEPNQLYTMHLECVYQDEINPNNNRVVYWFEKQARETWMPREYALGDETSDIEVAADAVTFFMPFKYRLHKIRFFLTTAPTGTDAEFDVNVEGASILEGGVLEISIGTNDSDLTDANQSIQPTGYVIPNGAKVSIDIDQVGSTIAGAGPKAVFYGWVIEDEFDQSSVGSLTSW